MSKLGEIIMNFRPERFLQECIADAAYQDTYGNDYLDDCEMGEELTFNGDLLTVENRNGKKLHYRITVEEVIL